MAGPGRSAIDAGGMSREGLRMVALLLSLLPLIVGAAVLPLFLILTLLLLRSAGGRAKAGAFAAGMAAVRLLQGLIFGYLFAGAIEAQGAAAGDDISSTVLLVGGIFMLVMVARRLTRQDDPDAPPPKWMAAINRLSISRSFAAGVVLMGVSMKQWVFTLSAIAVIDEARLGKAAAVAAYLVFVVLAQSLALAAILLAIAAPAHAAGLLDSERGWLERHGRALTTLVSLALGAWFIAKGASGLLGAAASDALPAPTLRQGGGDGRAPRDTRVVIAVPPARHITGARRAGS